MTLLAAFQTLLGRYSGQVDFAVGVPVANRNRAETERLVGYFVNVTVLRSDLSEEPSFKELVGRVKRTSLDAFQRQEMTLDQIVDAVKPPRDLSRNPLFQVMFALQNINLPPVPDLGIEISPFEDSPVPPSANFDLTLELFDNEEGFQGSLNFSTDLFQPDTIDDMVKHYQTLLEAALSEPDEQINLLPLLSVDAQPTADEKSNTTNLEYDASRLVQHLFEEQAEWRPNAVAVVHGDRSWTYSELNRQANRLAHRLLEHNVTPGTVIGIHLARSPELFMAVLAVLKAGAAYAPLDPDHTGDARERIRSILTEAGISLVLTSSALEDGLPAGQQQLMLIDDIDSSTRSEANPAVEVTGDHLAYILYTSGSTGRPKGVQVTHRSLLNAYHGWSQAYCLRTETSSHLQMASFGFDVFTGDLVRALCSGGKLVVCPTEVLLAPDRLVELMRRERVDAAEFVPHVLRNLVRRLEETGEVMDFMRLVVVGSDSWYAADHRRTQRVIGPGTRLINSYGLTEATIDSCFFEGDVDSLPDHAVVPIGRPFANVRLYIMDERMRLTPARVPGELYIGGDGVASGYVNAQLNADRFIPDPFSTRPAARLYRTGDRARRSADGQVEFLGRSDNQVKIRGYRIEPGEVEAALRRHPSISQAAVVAREGSQGDLQLVGYVVPQASDMPTIAELRHFLRQHVPAYMIPTTFVELPALPMTDSGKLKKSALPEPTTERSEMHGQYVPPNTATERQLTEIWAQVLELEKVGIHDDFFDLGGHSLLALRLVAKMRDAFPVELQLQHLFMSPTVAGVAEVIDAMQAGKSLKLATSATAIDWDAETNLDPTIRVTDGLRRSTSKPANALLTGATGFLGAFLVRELLEQTDLRLHCLVRARNVTQARDKIRRNLEQYRLGEIASSPRIVPICGDLAQPCLGIPDEDYRHLADLLDVIYHNGARVSSVYPYAVLKPANVSGTIETLRLATRTKLKPLHFVSTLSVLETSDYAAQDEVSEDQVLDAGESLSSGYAQSKFVAEKLISLAAARGVPTTIHRPGRIAGDSRSGASNLSDLTHLLIKLCIGMGKVPGIDGPIGMAPVDYVAQAVVAMTQDKSCYGRVFHLQNPQPVYLRDVFAAVREFGYVLDTVELVTWTLQAAEQGALSDDESLAALASLAGPESSQHSDEPIEDSEAAYPNIICRKTVEALSAKSIHCPAVDRSVLMSYFAFFVEQGFIAPPPTTTVKKGQEPNWLTE
jgi:amino acid adenylation domain-containing protein/thioester reductase-like protein